MSSHRDEGVIKFKFTLKRAPAPLMDQVISLEKWRALFYRLGFIGEYPLKKVGYGNLSFRLNGKSFIITGGQTGHLAHLQAHHYTKVISCDLRKGSVTAEGLIPPSSESLTHFGIYEANAQIQFIFHVHHSGMWNFLKDRAADSIPENFTSSTQEMLKTTKELLKGKASGIYVMKAQENGIISYGTTAEEAGRQLLDIYRKLGMRQ